MRGHNKCYDEIWYWTWRKQKLPQNLTMKLIIPYLTLCLPLILWTSIIAKISICMQGKILSCTGENHLIFLAMQTINIRRRSCTTADVSFFNKPFLNMQNKEKPAIPAACINVQANHTFCCLEVPFEHCITQTAAQCKATHYSCYFEYYSSYRNLSYCYKCPRSYKDLLLLFLR